MDCLTVGTRNLYRFVSDEAKTNMYVLVEKNQALIVDPHISDEVLAFLRQKEIIECTVFLTHEHSDHTCGLAGLQELFDIIVICQSSCAETIADRDRNDPRLTIAMLSIQDSKNGTNTADSFLNKYREFEYEADLSFETEFEYFWQKDKFTFRATPGHSPGGCCICWNNTAIFTGDSLMMSLPVITRFPGGSTRDYKNKTLPFLRSLDQKLVALPGHGHTFQLGDALAKVL